MQRVSEIAPCLLQLKITQRIVAQKRYDESLRGVAAVDALRCAARTFNHHEAVQLIIQDTLNLTDAPVTYVARKDFLIGKLDEKFGIKKSRGTFEPFREQYFFDLARFLLTAEDYPCGEEAAIMIVRRGEATLQLIKLAKELGDGDIVGGVGEIRRSLDLIEGTVLVRSESEIAELGPLYYRLLDYWRRIALNSATIGWHGTEDEYFELMNVSYALMRPFEQQESLDEGVSDPLFLFSGKAELSFFHPVILSELRALLAGSSNDLADRQKDATFAARDRDPVSEGMPRFFAAVDLTLRTRLNRLHYFQSVYRYLRDPGTSFGGPADHGTYRLNSKGDDAAASDQYDQPSWTSEPNAD